MFSRASGHPFLCVSLANSRLEPREFRESSNEDGGGRAQERWLPDRRAKTSGTPKPIYRTSPKPGCAVRRTVPSCPTPRKPHVSLGRFGSTSTANTADAPTADRHLWGWFMTAPLLFDPTGGVVFDPNTNEGTKLTKLGSEGRSTSTTITAFSILNRLHDAGYPAKDQKVLSFTDNVQDAALQAGHFNDFAQVVQLRSAIYQGAESRADQTLTYSTIGEAVFKSLNLPFLEFANRDSEPTPRPCTSRLRTGSPDLPLLSRSSRPPPQLAHRPSESRTMRTAQSGLRVH